MRNRLVLLALFCGLSTVALAQDEHKRAMELYKQKQYPQALVLLEESIASFPDWYFPILLKGHCHLKMGKTEEALRNYNDALTLEPPSTEIPRIKRSIAMTHRALKQYEKAIAGFTELLTLSPANKHFELFFDRGQCEMEVAMSDKKKAQAYYSKAIVSFSEALKKETNRKEMKVEASFKKAYAQYKIGNLRGGISSLEKSVKAFEEVIARNQKEKRAHEFIIGLQFRIVEKSKKGDEKVRAWNKAVSYLERYLKSWPEDMNYIEKKGLAMQGARRYKEAITVFQTVAMRKPKDGMTYFSIGSCEMADKQFNKAIASFAKAMNSGMQGDPRVYSFTANCYAKQKNSCDGNDKPLQQKAVDILAKGLKTLSGVNRQALQKEYDRNKDNLDILEGNLKTDSQNHAATISNITALNKSINDNTNLLIRNEEKHIQQATAELAAAIAEAKKTIASEKATRAKEYKQLKTFIAAAGKCGGAKYYPHFNKMKEMVASQPK